MSVIICVKVVFETVPTTRAAIRPFAIDEEGGGDAAGRPVGEFDQLGAARVVYRGVGHIERAHKGAGGCGVVVTDVDSDELGDVRVVLTSDRDIGRLPSGRARPRIPTR
jgi:hypothetical protein